MLPDFTVSGLLPPGVHSCDLGAFRQRFAIFDRSSRRLQIFEQFERLVCDSRNSAVVRRIVVGGSFVTSNAEPNDFDCILVLDPAVIGVTLRPFEYDLISRRMARRLFGGDALSAVDGSVALEQYLSFFQTTRDGESVGIVEIVP